MRAITDVVSFAPASPEEILRPPQPWFVLFTLLLALVVRIFAAGGTLDVERIAYGERQRAEAAESDVRREHDRDLEPVLEALPLDEPSEGTR